MKSYKKLYITAAVVIAVLFAAAYFYRYFPGGGPYVAVFNDEKIPLDEYLIYLVEQQRVFEQTGGDDIWDTDFDGEPAIEMAKRNALDSIVYVKAAIKSNEGNNLQSPYDGEELTKRVDDYYADLSENQKQSISLEAVRKVVEETALIADLPEDNVLIVEEMISTAVTEKNPEIWDAVGYLE